MKHEQVLSNKYRTSPNHSLEAAGGQFNTNHSQERHRPNRRFGLYVKLAITKPEINNHDGTKRTR